MTRGNQRDVNRARNEKRQAAAGYVNGQLKATSRLGSKDEYVGRRWDWWSVVTLMVVVVVVVVVVVLCGMVWCSDAKVMRDKQAAAKAKKEAEEKAALDEKKRLEKEKFEAAKAKSAAQSKKATAADDTKKTAEPIVCGSCVLWVGWSAAICVIDCGMI